LNNSLIRFSSFKSLLCCLSISSVHLRFVMSSTMTAAKLADEVIEQRLAGVTTEAEKKSAERKLFDVACLFFDNWFGASLIGSSN
jgi:hypothetical protein